MERHVVHNDIDPIETKEWLDALNSVINSNGQERIQYLLQRMITQVNNQGITIFSQVYTPYRNTIPVYQEPSMPGDRFIERQIRSLVRWNAVAMVQRANQLDSSLGGHLSSFASSATLYDVAYNHFFKGYNEQTDGDLIYFQGHASPGIYARAYLEGRVSEEDLIFFRRETQNGHGLSSYPHPYLMPDFWQFPTVSMGLGPIQAIYQAYFMQYLENRSFLNKNTRKIWAFLGDGETDEPESLGAISLASREKLDNLIFVVNCNLQRLDGPVRGNGKIIQELEGIFHGAGWNVIKVIWGNQWDALLHQDTSGVLQRIMDETLDGDYQNHNRGGQWIREHFFGKDPEALKLVSHLSDEELANLNRGGHDPKKIYAAYHAAVNHKGKPTVILAKTIKGYGLGSNVESTMVTHNIKKLSEQDLQYVKNRFNLPINNDQLAALPFIKPEENSEESKYLHEKRTKLGGPIPTRRQKTTRLLKTPPLSDFKQITNDSTDRAISTTMALNRIFDVLIKDQTIGQHVVPIVSDEARTFGMEGLFRRIGIYAGEGQKYQPQDADKLAFYKESKSGQILEIGISESGAHAAWIAAATSYSTHNIPMIPFYIFYSMFGFQRTGDLAWLSGDARARGFLIGAVSGRTTLNGEGLQHQDGHSHILASTIPNCISYDPTFSYELAVIIQHGLSRLIENQDDVFYYLTVMNEKYVHPAMPQTSEITEQIIKGLYLFQSMKPSKKKRVQLMGSGTIFNEVLAASDILNKEFDIESDIWSVTSFNELRKEGLTVVRNNRLQPNQPNQKSYVETMLAGYEGPVIAATDYMRIYADQIREFVPNLFISLGTDGFGRSDTRDNLRHFFEVNRYFIVISALSGLVESNQLDISILIEAMDRFKIDATKCCPFIET
ncbi:MAG: pyruvate dehydrogenase (acetyl-transferring), homodimeric type [Endozoicomonadaceae bacterium]|nr:pyruvate dehydrogenase (acetyl-transferring), homodimeric type [Endozoicomonadaceae bacterium]